MTKGHVWIMIEKMCMIAGTKKYVTIMYEL